VPDARRASGFPCDVAVLGGCGRSGLPLAIALADRGALVSIYDVSERAVAAVSAARMPFAEPGAALMLERVVAGGRLVASADPRIVRSAEHVIVAVPEGNPRRDAGPLLPSRGRHAAAAGPAGALAEHADPWDPGALSVDVPVPLHSAVRDCAGSLRDGQILILRTAAGPGDTARLEKIVAGLGVDVDVAFCPERIADGQAMTELFAIPQIVSSRTERGRERASRLFAMLTPVQVPMLPEEAELAALFDSAWRSIRFAAASQLQAMADDRGLDFERIRRGLVFGYPRAADLPPAEVAAGRHLLRDIRQLA
jgi:UDP-N-acetyl-D-mannosaminuronic acid dehydrogenase